MKFGMMRGICAGHLLFWWTSVHFCGSTDFRQWISDTLFVRALRNLVALVIWPIDTYSPNLVHFGQGVLWYHVATCISPSLMHLFFLSVCESHIQRNQQTSAADISQTGRQKWTKFSRLIEGALLYYIIAGIGDLRPWRTPSGTKILKGVKKIFVTLFSYIVWPQSVKFGTMRDIIA